MLAAAFSTRRDHALEADLLDARRGEALRINVAKAAGAELRTGETVRAIKPTANGVRIDTDCRLRHSTPGVPLRGRAIPKLPAVP